MTDPLSLSATALVEAYRTKLLSPVEVVKSSLDLIEKTNESLNAFYWIDVEGATKAARASEQRWTKGTPAGLLDGVPTSAKDALPMIGSPAFRGSIAYGEAEVNDTVDAPVIARLREHGAIFLGKTTMCDFGILPAGYSSKHGITRNPWDLSKNTGGSSSGGAASVAAGISPIVIGTDIVGSIRLPASFCGLFGLKPSQGRVPYYFPNSPSLVAGPMTRCVEDAALVLDVIALSDKRDFTALAPPNESYRSRPPSSPKGLKVGLTQFLGFGATPDHEVEALTNIAAKILQQAGCEIVLITPRFALEDIIPAENFYRARCFTEFMKCAPEWRKKATVIDQWSQSAGSMSARELYDCYLHLLRLREKSAGLLDDIDFLLLPTVPYPAYAAELPGVTVDRLFEAWSNTFLFNLTEQPASSIPCGLTSDGLPIGLQIVGHRFDDAGVLAFSALYEQLRGAYPSAPRVSNKALPP